MSSRIQSPYGSWSSPFSSSQIAAATIRLREPRLSDGLVYWLEGRPLEGGRTVIVRAERDGTLTEITPAPFNVRSRVHEYGGGAYLVHHGTSYFVNFSDQRLYKVASGVPVALTPPGNLRYADMVVEESRNRLVTIVEEHVEGKEAENWIGAVSCDGGPVKSLVRGKDFFANPRVSPDGKWLAWLSWNHPSMPWDGTELSVAAINEDGTLAPAKTVAGSRKESVFQPEWSEDGKLYFASDKTGWWNLYRWDFSSVTALFPREAEFGWPQWVFRMTSFALESETSLLATFCEKGEWQMGRLNLTTKAFEILKLPFTDFSYLQADAEQSVFIGGAFDAAAAVVQLPKGGDPIVLRRQSETSVPTDAFSRPEAIEYPTEGGVTAHAFFYPPTNLAFAAPADEKPPLLVISHGGPTAAADSTLDLSIQFWTSRGFGVLDVNYGGSTGFGRAYRDRLNGEWGIMDVEDCVNGARYLVERGRADRNRIAVRGGSAGGYTTLAALAFRDYFRAGASHYGVSDLLALQQETHKFESRYEYQLLGVEPNTPQALKRFHDRSPIHFVEQLSVPLILFQGLEDKVVPPNQAEKMFHSLKEKGIPVAYVPFEGEQHGFRKAENIQRALDAELYFYSKIFSFTTADVIAPVPIENLAK